MIQFTELPHNNCACTTDGMWAAVQEQHLVAGRKDGNFLRQLLHLI